MINTAGEAYGRIIHDFERLILEPGNPVRLQMLRMIH